MLLFGHFQRNIQETLKSVVLISFLNNWHLQGEMQGLLIDECVSLCEIEHPIMG